jgi:hypothetical protein
MKAKRTKEPVTPPPTEVPQSDRDVLIGAYKSGLISAWRRENEQGYRLTLGRQGDTYVEVEKLPRYLAGLAKGSS